MTTDAPPPPSPVIEKPVAKPIDPPRKPVARPVARARTPWGAIFLATFFCWLLIPFAVLLFREPLMQALPDRLRTRLGLHDAPAQTYLTAHDVMPLEQTLMAVQEKQRALEATLQNVSLGSATDPETGAPIAGNADMQSMIQQQIDAQLADIRSQLAVLKPAENLQEMTALQQNLLKLQQDVTARVAELQRNRQIDFRVLITFQELQSLALQNRPFAAPLQRLLALSLDEAELLEAVEALAPFAPTGRPAIDTVQASFAQAITDMQQAAYGSDDSFGGQIKRNLGELFKVRRIDTEGMGEAAIVARAELALQKQDVSTAVREIRSLSKAQQPRFSNWLAQAKAYQEVPVLLDTVELRVAELMHDPKEADSARAEPTPATSEESTASPETTVETSPLPLPNAATSTDAP